MEADNAALAAQVMSDWKAADLTAREKALCAYAEKLTERPADMTPADLDELRSHGLDDAGCLDLVQVIAYFNSINRIADALGVDLEDFMDPDSPPWEREP